MILELFKIHCAVCNKKVLKNESIARFGVYFCSSEHVKKYKKEVTMKKRETGGDCCGL